MSRSQHLRDGAHPVPPVAEIAGWRKEYRSGFRARQGLGPYLPDRFRQRFHADINRKLRKELLFLKLAGIVRGEETLTVTERGMYPVSIMMREFFASLNGLREHYIEKQI